MCLCVDACFGVHVFVCLFVSTCFSVRFYLHRLGTCQLSTQVIVTVKSMIALRWYDVFSTWYFNIFYALYTIVIWQIYGKMKTSVPNLHFR